MRFTNPNHRISAQELKALDQFFTRQRQHCAESLARERAESGPLSRRIGSLSDQLRRYDTLHARTRAYGHRSPVEIDAADDDAAALHELKAFSRTLT